MKFCPRCQTEYEDTKNFCRRDGTPLEIRQANETTTKTSEAICSQCGKPMLAEEQFCDHCGTRAEGSFQSSNGQEKPSSASPRRLRLPGAEYFQHLSPEKREFHRGAVLGFGAAFLIVLGILGYQRSSSSSSTTPITSAVPKTQDAKTETPPIPVGPFGGQSHNTPVMTPPSTTLTTGEGSPAPTRPLEGQPPSDTGTPSPQEQHNARDAVAEPQETAIPSGMYRVISPTPLRSEPRDDAPVVTQLKSGMKITVVGAAGDYLKVTSKKGRAPGYVLKAYTALIQREQ